MALPWGVKASVAPEAASEVETFFASIEGTQVDCGDDTVVEVLKAGVKERKGSYTLIFRYVIV
ncbi:MAG: hypothetical protein CW716_03775 [Candidatus Bathyarchaeum sp.]|nr:MAG: hypothetical protein CW716_03775 [Candidatus Bathyarchaeum sp.]